MVTHPVELYVASVRHGATLGDLSRTGMFVRMQNPLPSGIAVTVAMTGAEGGRLHTRGIVVRSVLGPRTGIGLALREPCEPADDLFGIGVEQLLRRAARERCAPVLSGELGVIELSAVLTMLEHERKTCRVVIGDHWIEIAGGRVVDAGITGTTVDAHTAIMKALDLQGGRFEVYRRELATAEVGLLPITHLLLEHARIADESSAVRVLA